MVSQRNEIRAEREQVGRRTAVLDDDPTGSQSVHDVAVVTVLDPDAYAAALREESTAFIWTNTRSMSEDTARRIVYGAGRDLFQLEQRIGAPLDIVSRSDSTLRGHFRAEIEALDVARTEIVGSGYDGVLVVPAYLEAGRFTSGDIHWAKIGDTTVRVGETEFAHDADFGYRSSNLRNFVEEKTNGAVSAAEMLTVGLDDIRGGGSDRVAEILRSAHDLQYVTVNAETFDDLDTVVVGLQRVQREGQPFLFRTGPSFVRALIGNEPIDTLTGHAIRGGTGLDGHGLAVVGSHVGLTGRQVERARQLGNLAWFEVSASALADEQQRGAYVAELGARVRTALETHDVLLSTSRERVTTDDASVQIAQTISSSVAEIVHGALNAHLSWMVAKGGITSHDIAVQGLGIRRGRILGQLFPGMVSVLTVVDAAELAIRMPYVIFAGNVGDDNALADVIQLLRAPEAAASGPGLPS